MLFPGGKRFAFSILDDTDDATLQNVKPVYDRLRQHGFRTTKTAWPFDYPEGSRRFFAAETLQNPAYRDFVHSLVDEGFELAFHGATMESSCRQRTVEALDFLRNEFGSYPRVFCNHGQNRENLYWGHKRFQTGAFRAVYRLARREAAECYAGENEESEYFWGDLCSQRITYVRNFTFHRLNMIAINPEMPYRLPGTKYVNYWFSTADAPDVHAFNRLLTPERIDELEREGGVCIVSTHFGKGFVREGRLNPETGAILRNLAERPGWFVPVSSVLDLLVANRAPKADLGYVQRMRLEWRFLMDQLKLASRAARV